MISLQNDFVHVLLGHYYFYNICHILCTCIHRCEYACGISVHPVWGNFWHIRCMNTCYLQCVFDSVYFQTAFHIVYTEMVSLHCECTCVPSGLDRSLTSWLSLLQGCWGKSCISESISLHAAYLTSLLIAQTDVGLHKSSWLATELISSGTLTTDVSSLIPTARHLLMTLI